MLRIIYYLYTIKLIFHQQIDVPFICHLVFGERRCIWDDINSTSKRLIMFSPLIFSCKQRISCTLNSHFKHSPSDTHSHRAPILKSVLFGWHAHRHNVLHMTTFTLNAQANKQHSKFCYRNSHRSLRAEDPCWTYQRPLPAT